MHEQKFKDLLSSTCLSSSERSMLELKSRGLGSIPTRGGVIFCFTFCNTNLHNIARSDRIRFKTKNLTGKTNYWINRTTGFNELLD